MANHVSPLKFLDENPIYLYHIIEQKITGEFTMAIITISRELAALGDETARELAGQLGYHFIERSSLEEKMKARGIDETKLEKFDEKKPSLLNSLSKDKDDYLYFLKASVFEEAEQGNCIFIGRGAGMILKGVPGVLPVFLTAPEEIRIERVKSYFHCDERHARQIIEQADDDREGYYRYFFNIDWKDASNYYLTLNTGCLHPGLCASLIKSMKDKIISVEDEKHNIVRIRELSLAHEIKHHILAEREIAIQFLEAEVTGNKIYLYGAASSQILVESAVSAVRETFFGGKDSPDYTIKSEIQVVQEYNVMP